MSGPSRVKACLVRYNQKLYDQFIRNDDTSLSLLSVSSIPWIVASKIQDHFTKTVFKLFNPAHKLRFIQKNGKPYGFTWQTTASVLHQAMRWGIVESHSITAKTIAALGQYRVTAHKRIARGMISNSHHLKLSLLSLYQDRFEALQPLETLANITHEKIAYESAFHNYIDALNAIKATIEKRFEGVDKATSGFDDETIIQLKHDIDYEIFYARSHLNSIASYPYQAEARGHDSTGEFINQCMIRGLYQLQGINQDVTYSINRPFALTRGLLNNCIEDARKGIDDYQANMHNCITDKHHGKYGADDSQVVTYDFSGTRGLTPARKRDILLAISFIEGCDALVVHKDSTFALLSPMSEKKPSEILDVIHATSWKAHRDIKTLLISVGYYIKNAFANLVVSTKPWQFDSWRNKDFHLFASTLQAMVEPHNSLWQNVWSLFQTNVHMTIDLVYGIRNFGADVAIRLPEEIINDYNAAFLLPSLEATLQHANQLVDLIVKKESDNLQAVFKACDYQTPVCSTPDTELASVDYLLGPLERHNFLTALSHSIHQFSSVFSHNIYSKDPFGGMLFTAGYIAGAGALYFPSATSGILGQGYTQCCTQYAYAMNSTKIGAAISCGLTQAQLASLATDFAASGSNSHVVDGLYKACEDPLMSGSYLAAAYGLGYVLTHGINGYDIPWFSKYCQAELGTYPSTAYPFIGGKTALFAFQALEHGGDESGTELPIVPWFSQNSEIRKFNLLSWMLKNAVQLPKLEAGLRFELSRHLAALFEKKQSDSLKQLLVEPQGNSSVAYQTIFIPLIYTSFVLRVMTAFVASIGLSAVSLIGKTKSLDNPWKPFIRANKALVTKAWDDITSWFTLASTIKDSCILFLTSMAKQLIYPSVMVTGRIFAVFGIKSAHFIYNTLSSFHNLHRRIEERFYPARLFFTTESANPADTIARIPSSYEIIVQKTKRTKDNANSHDKDNSELSTPGGKDLPRQKSASNGLFIAHQERLIYSSPGKAYFKQKPGM